ncbi:flagellar motor switch protein FliN [Granulosicoccus antarcticus]|uniref:Flagellar motor switch protein FliN n=1 Tax=Granulosicoccus antarcticus IMCC3135 TaxID=1192854 RepID=A0A2Z2NPB7_9GAMM|nr:flagellar motor switch protein FliN [Granulosicoccus antarcticus]ASJ71781.1 Flagellar motor switch protein FliN [Granulosicoccus antarcticus IMCC3135]
MSEDNTARDMPEAEDTTAADAAAPDAENFTDVDPAANAGAPEAEGAGAPAATGEESVRSVERPDLGNGPEADLQDRPTADIAMILDIPVTLSMEIGQTRISINELLKLSKDSVIELQRMADEPMDVLVNGTLVAHGEAVVVGDRFGIRLTDVISPQERLRKFG